MTKPMVKIHDAQSDEIVEREMSDSEFAEFQNEKNKALEEQQAQIDKIAAKQVLLNKLGITEEEAKLLLS